MFILHFFLLLMQLILFAIATETLLLPFSSGQIVAEEWLFIFDKCFFGFGGKFFLQRMTRNSKS